MWKERLAAKGVVDIEGSWINIPIWVITLAVGAVVEAVYKHLAAVHIHPQRLSQDYATKDKDFHSTSSNPGW